MKTFIRQIKHSYFLSIFTILSVIWVVWLAGAVFLNQPRVIEGYQLNNVEWTFNQLIEDTWSMKRPVLPTPMQIGKDMFKNIFTHKINSKRSLVYHGWITLSSTLLGFVTGTFLGVLLAVGIIYVPLLNKSLMPWVVASQTVPILAIAPMIIVVLGSIGLVGLIPKSIISAYLCFFPVTINMVKGLRSVTPVELDLAYTYYASRRQIFWKFRLPASVPYLFVSLKVAFAISLVGAIIGELPTGARAGLGSRLLVGSYYGQTVQIWSALISTAIIAGVLIMFIGYLERLVGHKMGFRN